MGNLLSHVTVAVSLPQDSHQNMVESGEMKSRCSVLLSFEIRDCESPQKSLHGKLKYQPLKH